MANNKSNAYRSRKVWDKTQGVCAHCGKTPSSRRRTVDHFIPRSDGGGYDSRNLFPLCRQCNAMRGSNPVDPISFYPYATPTMIQECLEYKEDFISIRRSMDGTVY